MLLKSRLFGSSKRLNDCAVIDSKHVLTGDKGEYVSRIQSALLILGTQTITGAELADGFYGPSTARAVLAYKRSRAVINFKYQTKADNIVGKMTIQRLDIEILAFEMRAQLARIPT